jgi:hypothetical protein
MVAWANAATISQCYTNCLVKATDQIAGGISADIQGTSQITDCYSTGEVISKMTLGGISGRIQHNSKILRCFATGNITATGALQVGGIVGYAFNTMGITGTPEISYCLAFSSQLTVPNIAVLGRILGMEGNIVPVLSNNYAWDEMWLNTESPPPGYYSGPFDPNDKHGGNISAYQAVCEGKNAPNTIYATWDFPDVWTFDYTNYHVVTHGDKTNLPILSAFNNTAFSNALQIPHLPLDEGACDETPDFIPVTDITNVPTDATTGIGLTLVGTVIPANATHQTIVWSVKTDGGTGSIIAGGVLTATNPGIVNVEATIADGVAEGEDYTKVFDILVTSEEEKSVSENMAQKIQIFPNPTHKEIFIKSELLVKKVEIYSVIGVLLLSENKIQKKIDVANLSKGIYILKIDFENDIVLRKFVKE